MSFPNLVLDLIGEPLSGIQGRGGSLDSRLKTAGMTAFLIPKQSIGTFGVNQTCWCLHEHDSCKPKSYFHEDAGLRHSASHVNGGKGMTNEQVDRAIYQCWTKNLYKNAHSCSLGYARSHYLERIPFSISCPGHISRSIKLLIILSVI